MNLIEQIDLWAQNEPTRLAYDYLGQEYTYQQLKQASDAVAHRLLTMNLSAGPIMVYGGQEFATLATFLGCVKAGHAYIPVDSHSPKERLEIINQIAQPVACVKAEEVELTVEIPVIEPTELAGILEQMVAPIAKDHYVSGAENFYIIFTSGTTGLPKGVQISHDNLASFVKWMQLDFGLESGATFLAQAPYSFDLSVMSIYPSLSMGGKLAVLPRQITDNFKELFAALPKLSLDAWVSTPSFMDICLMQPTFDQEHLPALKTFLFCGEELTHKTAAMLKQRFPAAKIYNTYGPTEATVAISAVEISREILDNYGRLPIGYVKRESEIVLVDNDLQPVEVGQPGEILLLGPGISKGYLNNPEKTAHAFVEYQGKAAYRTGDLGQFDDQGLLFYKGRLDFQVKMHGFRIELEEVDHHLDKVSLINQATTVPKYDKDHKVNQLIAYVVAEKNDYPTELALTQAIKKELAETTLNYMIPQRFKYVDSLPLTMNGKIDRKSLMQEVNS